MKVIVLDRDGVINEDSDNYIKHPDEWIPIPNSIESIIQLKKAGWTVVIATNQSGIKRGFYDMATLSAMHQKMQEMLSPFFIDWISFSPYTNEHNSPCRKPAIGMLQAIENRFNFSLEGSPLVGDSLSDISVAKSKKLKPYLVRTGKGERTLATQSEILKDVLVYDSLKEATQHILENFK